MLQHVNAEQRWSTSATSACLRKAGFPIMTNGNPAVRKDERARTRQRT